MAFTTQRGRPRSVVRETDPGTPELRLKHALGLTGEPIDLCLEKQLITRQQHWSGLHLRWLYTLRYGAPNLTTRYADKDTATQADAEDPTWRTAREREYHEAAHLLKTARYYEPIMRLAIFNECPAFLNQRLRERAWQQLALATELAHRHEQLRAGLELLVRHWRDRPQPGQSI